MSNATHETIQPAPVESPRSIRAIIADLSKPVNPQRLKTKTVPTKNGGSFTADYLPWYQCVRYLDNYAPGWSYEVRSFAQIGEAMVMTVRRRRCLARGFGARTAQRFRLWRCRHECRKRRPAPRRRKVWPVPLPLRKIITRPAHRAAIQTERRCAAALPHTFTKGIYG